MRDGGRRLLAGPGSYGHTPAAGAVAVGEAEGQSAGPEPGGRGPADVVQVGVAGVRLVDLAPHL